MDASGSIADTIAAVDAASRAADPDSGTLVLRADIHGGLIELGDGILSPSLAHVLERLAVQALRRPHLATHPRPSRGGATVVRGVPGDARRHRGAAGRRAGQVSGRAGAAVPAARRPPDGASRPARGHRRRPLLEAATFALGGLASRVPLVTMPVTTLGLIDTAIGGKGGVDLAGVGRNLLGAIHQPTATILDVGSWPTSRPTTGGLPSPRP